MWLIYNIFNIFLFPVSFFLLDKLYEFLTYTQTLDFHDFWVLLAWNHPAYSQASAVAEARAQSIGATQPLRLLVGRDFEEGRREAKFQLSPFSVTLLKPGYQIIVREELKLRKRGWLGQLNHFIRDRVSFFYLIYSLPQVILPPYFLFPWSVLTCHPTPVFSFSEEYSLQCLSPPTILALNHTVSCII